MWEVPPRWSPAASGTAVTRVQVWSAGEFVAETTDFKDGGVTERRTSGPRSSLSLTLEPSAQWLEWLALPNVELRPSSGLSWGTSEHLCPLGVYPVLPPKLSLPAREISISAPDRWQLLLDDDFTYVQPLRKYALDADSWEMRRLAAAIIDQTDLVAQAVFWDAPTTWALDQYALLDKSRSDTLKELADALAGDVFVDRVGTPRIQSRVTQPGLPLVDGEDGTVITVETEPSYADVYNQVGVSTTAQGVSFFPAFAEITDATHPAHRSRIRRRSMRYSSSLIFTRAQAFDVAVSLLSKRSISVGWTVSCVPDPSRMPGDVCQVSTDFGTFDAVVEEVTHPFGDGPQTVKLSAA